MTTKTSGISEATKFACPKWDKANQRLSFPPGTSPEQEQEYARKWMRYIQVLLEGQGRGLTTSKRRYLSKLLRQLESFVGPDSEQSGNIRE